MLTTGRRVLKIPLRNAHGLRHSSEWEPTTAFR